MGATLARKTRRIAAGKRGKAPGPRPEGSVGFGSVGQAHRLTRGGEATLERCIGCPSLLVHPTRWQRLEPDVWQIDLRCPECRRSWREVVPTAAVRRLDEVLRAGRGLIEKHLEEIERIEREEQVESFVEALRADAILPEDFGRPR
jgi:hypothetical protein